MSHLILLLIQPKKLTPIIQIDEIITTGNRIIWVTGLNKIIKNLLFSYITSLEHKSVEIREDLGAISYIHKTK